MKAPSCSIISYGVFLTGDRVERGTTRKDSRELANGSRHRCRPKVYITQASKVCNGREYDASLGVCDGASNKTQLTYSTVKKTQILNQIDAKRSLVLLIYIDQATRH